MSGNFDHVSCNNSEYWSEVSGHIDVGNFLSRFHINLRPGREAQDLDQILTYLMAHRQRIVANLTPVPMFLPQANPLGLPTLMGNYTAAL
jgi:hypothetical protein